MKQSRLMSLVESVTNVAVGYGIAVISQILIFPVFGLHTTLTENLQIGAIFTAVSIARSFTLRRLFEAIRVRAMPPSLMTDGGSGPRPLPYSRDFGQGRDRASLPYSRPRHPSSQG